MRSERRDTEAAPLELVRADGTERAREGLGERLDRVLGSSVTVLHHRCPLTGDSRPIDHLVIAPSGVWVVIAGEAVGRVMVESSSNGSSGGLSVDRCDQAALLAAARDRAAVVASSLELAGIVDAPVYPVLCLVRADWDFFVSPVRLDRVLVTWPSELVDDIRLTHRWATAAMARAALHLREALPARARTVAEHS